MNRCAILAGGDVPDKDEYKESFYWQRYNYIICADCGYRHAVKYGILPDLIIGDFDSFGDEPPMGAEVIRSVPEKDDTDTLMAVKKAIELGYTSIDLYGALGGKRFEHSFANIQTMIYALQQGCSLEILGESHLLIQGADDGEVTYRKPDGGMYLSVFALTEDVGIEHLRGVKYPLEDYRMVQSFPIGVSNEITDEAALLRIKDGMALVILTPMADK
jgi:thiamine pyrophosphokinase